MKYKNYTVEDFVQDKYFREWAESGNPEADEFWNRWMSENPGQISAVNEAVYIVRNMQFHEHQLNSGEKNLLWENIRKETAKSGQKGIPVRYLKLARYRGGEARQKSADWKRIYLAAAVVLLGIAMSAVWLMTPQGTDSQLVYSTDFGEIRELQLHDGSVVTLNANSSITLAGNWDAGQDREVWLQGEAFFDVTHLENQQRFIVYADEIGARVLGTEFSVYNRGSRAVFELASGSIMLESGVAGPSITMEPGDRVIYDDPGSSPRRMQVNAEEVAAWKDNLLIFRRTSLAEISSLLKTNYDLDVNFTDQAVAGQYFTGTVPADNIDVLFETLARTFDLHYTRANNSVTIRKN